MAKKWSDITSNPKWETESPERQIEIRDAFFDRVISPNLKGVDVNSVRSDFYNRSGVGATLTDEGQSKVQSSIDMLNADLELAAMPVNKGDRVRDTAKTESIYGVAMPSGYKEEGAAPSGTTLSDERKEMMLELYNKNVPESRKVTMDQMFPKAADTMTDTVIKEGGRVGGQILKGVANAPGEILNELLSGTAWLDEKLGLGDGTYKAIPQAVSDEDLAATANLILPKNNQLSGEDVQPQTMGGKVAEVVLPYMVNPFKAVKDTPANIGKLKRLGNVVEEQAKNSLVGAAVTSGADDERGFGETYLTDVALGTAIHPVIKGVSAGVKSVLPKGKKETLKYVDEMLDEKEIFQKGLDQSKGLKDIPQLVEDFEKGAYQEMTKRGEAFKILDETYPELATHLRNASGRGGFSPAAREAGEKSQTFITDNKESIGKALNLVQERAKSKAVDLIDATDESYTSFYKQLKSANPAQRQVLDTADLKYANKLNKATKVVEDWAAGGVGVAKAAVKKSLNTKLNEEAANIMLTKADELMGIVTDSSVKKGTQTWASKSAKELMDVANKVKSGGAITSNDIVGLSKVSDSVPGLNDTLSAIKGLNKAKPTNTALETAKGLLTAVAAISTQGVSLAAQAGGVAARSASQMGTKNKIRSAGDFVEDIIKGVKTKEEVTKLLSTPKTVKLIEQNFGESAANAVKKAIDSGLGVDTDVMKMMLRGYVKQDMNQTPEDTKAPSALLVEAQPSVAPKAQRSAPSETKPSSDSSFTEEQKADVDFIEEQFGKVAAKEFAKLIKGGMSRVKAIDEILFKYNK